MINKFKVNYNLSQNWKDTKSLLADTLMLAPFLRFPSTKDLLKSDWDIDSLSIEFLLLLGMDRGLMICMGGVFVGDKLSLRWFSPLLFGRGDPSLKELGA